MRLALALFFFGGALFAAPNADVQELRLSIEHVGFQIHSQNVEINLLQERLLSLEQGISGLKQEQKNLPLEKRILHLEKVHETLIADLKTLKNHFNETTVLLSQCQSRLSNLDKLTSDISTLKASLQSILSLIQGESKCYTVQAGDSLGKIALDNKTDIKTLKKLNDLNTDKIFAGQKLLLP